MLKMAVKTISHKYPTGKPVVNSSSTEAPCLGSFKLCQVDFITNHHHTHAPCYWMNGWRWKVTEEKSLLDPVSSCLQPSYQSHFWICTICWEPEPNTILTPHVWRKTGTCTCSVRLWVPRADRSVHLSKQDIYPGCEPEVHWKMVCFRRVVLKHWILGN